MDSKQPTDLTAESSSKIANIGAELESDMRWREDEIRNLENHLLNNDLQVIGPEYDQLRKCLWIMLYAHYEGFFKFALHTYVNALNMTQLTCQHVHERLAAWTLDPIFKDIEHRESREPFFASAMPEEENLHQLFRRTKMVQEWRLLENRKLSIPDTAYSTKSNLDYVRLQQLLYQVGFDHNAFASYASDIAHLVIRRHSIAHGNPENRVLGIGGKEYQDVRLSTFKIMSQFSQLIIVALSEQSYKRKSTIQVSV